MKVMDLMKQMEKSKVIEMERSKDLKKGLDLARDLKKVKGLVNYLDFVRVIQNYLGLMMVRWMVIETEKDWGLKMEKDSTKD